MARLTEERMKDLVTLMRSARIDLEAAKETFQMAHTLHNDHTVKCDSPIGAFILSKEQILSAASAEYEAKSDAHAELECRFNALCDTMGVAE